MSETIHITNFYAKSNVGWKIEFEKFLKEHTCVDLYDSSKLTYQDWGELYVSFIINDGDYVRCCPFNDSRLFETFSFEIYKFKNNGFYNFVKHGDINLEGNEDWEFVKRYRTEEDAIAFMKYENNALRSLKKQESTEKTLDQLTLACAALAKDMGLSKVDEKLGTFSWKEAMMSLIDGKRVEARVCIPGLPESENGWFEVKFATDSEDKKFGESIKFGRDWEYRILDDSKEREELFDECEKLGIINVSKVSKVSTSLLRDIVDSVKSIDLDWKAIAKQINEETK